jgi:surface polysaccharide O-acyltransferase-like enzyme
MSIAVIDKINVPLFFMVSGALLLGRNESVRLILTKRVARTVAVLVIFTGVYYLLRSLGIVGRPNPHLSDFFRADIWGPLWFLYAYISFLLALPLLRAVAQNLQRSSWLLLVVTALTVQAFIASSDLWAGASPTSRFNSPLLTIWLGCPLLGYYLSSQVGASKVPWKHIALVFVGMTATVATSCWLVELDIAKRSAPHSQTYLEFLAPWLAGFVFIAIRWLLGRAPISCSAVSRLRTLGALTFGAYLFEGITRRYLFDPVANLVDPPLNGMMAALTATAVCVLAGMLLAAGLRLIPGVKKLL